MLNQNPLFQPITLPCGVVLKNRLAKSAMSDSLGDGTGHPTHAQNRLYQRWANGGIGFALSGEVQATPDFAEKPGNLVLDHNADLAQFKTLATQGRENGAQLWLQLGHAGALAFAPTSDPKGPSAIDVTDLHCAAMTTREIDQTPIALAQTAKLAQQAGFGGVQIHAAHGFLLSQFLSPLFNKRTDSYGGTITNRMRLLLAVIAAVRAAVGPAFPIAVKLNSSDQLAGGFDENDALLVVAALEKTSIDLIDISGGTYFPGAVPASDSAGAGPYFLSFAQKARGVTTKPLMLTGGFKTKAQAEAAVASGIIDIAGLARALVLHPDLPDLWMTDKTCEPAFPRFPNAPEGGITAWYTVRMTAIGEDRETDSLCTLDEALQTYMARDAARTLVWKPHFKR